MGFRPPLGDILESRGSWKGRVPQIVLECTFDYLLPVGRFLCL